MHKYVIMGPQGCGKGTQAKLLADKLDLVHISVGDIFRWHVASHTKLAARIRRLIAHGHLVPDAVVEKVVRERLELHDWNYGFILDGFPRSRPQAEFFLESYDIDAVLLLDVPEEALLERVLSRRLCEGCGLDYNLIFHRPNVEGTCDVCGGKLIAREDDQPEAVRRRLDDYKSKTEPVIDLFRQKELVLKIDARGPAESVHDELMETLNRDARRSVHP